MQLTKHLLLVCMLMVCFSASLWAQDKQITGKIHTNTGVGISGAFIQGKTSKRGTVTNEAGSFTIVVPTSEEFLLVSSLGFLTQTFSIKGQTIIDVTLTDDPKQLTDVVVTAYGIKKEAKRLGYAAQVVKGADLVKARDANPINSLVGKVAGLSVGANPEMLGRPELVLRGSKDLLFVIDGVPVNTDTWNVSPDDIETYTILKGANAAALYGSRGINGAIIITTKRGTKDKKGWQVDVNSSTVLENGFISEPVSQTEYGRGTTFKYSYGDQLYDNKQRLPEWGPHFDGQLVKQFDSPYDITTGIRTATPFW